jgi:hypothetical protein
MRPWGVATSPREARNKTRATSRFPGRALGLLPAPGLPRFAVCRGLPRFTRFTAVCGWAIGLPRFAIYGLPAGLRGEKSVFRSPVASVTATTRPGRCEIRLFRFSIFDFPLFS